MDRADRAKQFMPFAALKGYEEAIREREHIVIERSELSEERLDELDNVFKRLRVGDIATCIYYKASEECYIKVTGMVSKIDIDSRVLKIVNKRIEFDDIYDLEITES
jgi:hypothetical protein